MVYTLCFMLIAVGLYGILVKKNLVKIIIGFVIMEAGAHLLLILIGYRRGGEVPILEKGVAAIHFAQKSVDPVPQALVLTSIVIGLGILALMVAMAIRMYERFHTFDINELRRLKG
ncbi:NADH-quinone oxidoreductase subunit K [candidate division FCPU426 bacterium]|nr:NADH-quinone oxidoreductase subunit K [candidate division FCPU426 bacterium]